MTNHSTQPPAPDTPELEKIHINRDDSQTIGEFLEWATTEGGYNFTRTVGEADVPAHIEGALAEYFGVDLMKVEEERRTLHAYIAQVADITEQEPTP